MEDRREAPAPPRPPSATHGQYTLGQSGLQYLRARFYDPATAEFLTLDPIVATTRKPYPYSSDNPVSLTDPTGNLSSEVSAVAGGVCGGALEIPVVGDEGEAELQQREEEHRENVASEIANGHAFDEHLEEFDVESSIELQEIIEEMKENPTDLKEIRNGRTAYYDRDSDTLVVENPSSPDRGTVFKLEAELETFKGLE